MKKLLEFIVRSIVASPEQIEIREENTDQGLELTIVAPKNEIGTLIGRQGKIIKALKTILALKAGKKRFFLEVREKQMDSSFLKEHLAGRGE